MREAISYLSLLKISVDSVAQAISTESLRPFRPSPESADLVSKGRIPRNLSYGKV